MGKKTSPLFIFLFIVFIALLLLLAACERPPAKGELNKTKVKKVHKKALNASVSNLSRPTTNATSGETGPVRTEAEPSTCSVIMADIELEIDAARNASSLRDKVLYNATNEYVIAQEDLDNAQKTSNPARTLSAQARLQRSQALWEDARTSAQRARDEVKRLKLVLVKARDDCDPDYVPPYVNASVDEQAAVPQSNCSRPVLRTLQNAYDGLQANITDAEEELQRLQDSKDRLTADLDAANAAGNNAEASAIQNLIDEKNNAIRDLQRHLDEMRTHVVERRDNVNPVRLECGFDAIRRPRTARDDSE